MNKKIIMATLALVITLPASANSVEPAKPHTLAVLDTALDTSLPIFSGKIVHEVCILDWNSCPNGKSFMEGPGSATLPLNIISKNGFDHGTQMTSAAVQTNPNINIVFVRIIGNTPDGSRQISNESTFVNAMNWVLNNKSRFNITAVAMSQGHHNLGSGQNYCPSTPATESIVNSLVNEQVAVFFPAGNYRDKARVSWPSCIKSSMSISATAIGDGPAIYTNYDKNTTDFFARGSMQVNSPGGKKFNSAGTSISTQVAASVWVGLKNKYPSYGYDQILSIMNNKSTKLPGRTIQGKVVDFETVLNG